MRSWLSLLAALLTAGAHALEDQRLIGWKGETHSVLKSAATDVTLKGGLRMPLIGFGTAGLTENTAQAVTWALEAGYRLLDSAQAREWYREDLVGEALKGTTVPRSSLFLTSKLHPRHLGYNVTMAQFEQSLRDLHTDYLDLFLLHYPMCWGTLCGGVEPAGTWEDSWRALEELYRQGKVKALGVSNFDVTQLARLVEIAKVGPHVVSSNSDPFSQNRPTQEFCKEHGIVFQAYSSLGTQWWGRGYANNPVLYNRDILAIAKAHDVTAGQVVLRWAIQNGQAIIPKSGSKDHIAANLQLDFVLTSDEMATIDSMDGRIPEKVE